MGIKLLEVTNMLNNQTIEKLLDMNLKTMARMLDNPQDNLYELSFEDRLGMMVEKEWLARKNARIKRLIKQANFKCNACVEDISYRSDRKIDKSLIQKLSRCSFVEQKLNVILSGPTGCGKSYIACALGNSACRLGLSVKYYRIPELLLELNNARQENIYMKFLRKIQKARLLVIDDWGLKPYTLEESRDILELAESRYNKCSTIYASQIPCEQWYELIPDPTIADAILDRIIHNAYKVNVDGPSMRKIESEKFLE